MSGAPNILIEAGAGTGKTWTVTEGVHPMLHSQRKDKNLPSEEQQAIWDEMAKDGYPSPIHMTSFTTDAADQLEERCPKDFTEKAKVTSSSTYGMGLGFAKRAGQGGYVDKWGHKYRGLTNEWLGKTRFQMKDDKPGLWDAIAEVQQVARLSLKLSVNKEEWIKLADHFGTEWEHRWVDDAVEGTNAVLKAGREDVGKYDFTDMVYLPVVQGLVQKKYHTLVVDEFQDMGRAQQELCLLAGWRMILIGDPHQAIYGFAGADQSAFERIEWFLGMTQKGLSKLPLRTTRRCCKSVVREANKFLPEGEKLVALPNAPEGEVIDCMKHQFYETHLPKLLKNYKFTTSRQMDFMVICPTNAPLISLMFRLMEKGVRAYVHGKDVTKSMVTTVEKHATLADLTYHLNEKMDKLLERKPSRTTMTQIDITKALQDIARKCTSKDQVIASLKSIFSDEPRNGYLRLSSIHRAKGLENQTIVLWERDRCKSKWSTKAWQHLQDKNLEYVGITRAKTKLIQVDG